MKNNKYNPIQQANYIKSEFSKYIKSTFQIRDNVYNELFEKELIKMKDSLYKGPYLCSYLSFVPSYSIYELVKNNVLDTDFLKIGGIEKILHRKLYSHQYKAIKQIEKGHSVVITTGTGSGKTECFLYPIIDQLIKECKSSPNRILKPGIRAIFLFPMNALVNDQIVRLRKILAPLTEIKFAFYTGETPQNFKSIKDKSIIDNRASNELITRDEIRRNPPQILFTNYSMLEYLLIRPTDSTTIISKEALQYWKYVVLDESHTYKGTLGTEISLLLRRLMATAQKTPQFILTSATLGRGKQDIESIKSFAHELTSVDYKNEDIIFAERISLDTKPTDYHILEDDFTKMLDVYDNLNSFKIIFEKYSKYDDKLSIQNNIYNLLFVEENTRNLYLCSKEGCDFYNALDFLNFKYEQNLVSLIELIMKAKNEIGLKLFDVKYHMFVKAPDGAFITIGKDKKLSLINKNYIDGYKAFKIGICQNCKTPYIMGRTGSDNILYIDDEVDIDETYTEKINKLEYYLLADSLTELEIEDIENNHADEFIKYSICPVCGKIRKYDEGQRVCDHDEEEVIIYKFESLTDSEDEEGLYSHNIKRCPICNFSTKNGGTVMGFHIGKDRATALLAQILYRSMPYEEVVEEERKSIFSNETIYKTRKFKQFIVFSDARQQAAFFSKFLNYNDQNFLKKRIVWDVISNEENNHAPISYSVLRDKLKDRFLKMDYIGGDDEKAMVEAKSALLVELLNIDGNNSAEGLGIFAFELQLPKDYDEKDNVESALESIGFENITAEQFKIATKYCLNKFRVVPAINHDLIGLDEQQLDDLLQYRKYANYVSLNKEKSKSGNNKYVQSFLPQNKENKLTKYLSKAFNINSIKAKELLEFIYNAAYSSVLDSNTMGERIDCNKYRVLSYRGKGVKFYYCPKCKKLTMYNINNVCPTPDCDGTLIEVSPDEIDKLFENNYYRYEYMNRPLERVTVEEHTAQLKSDKARSIQNDFIEKKFNIISCSTTFEMGIDIGGLSTVFLRNVPPLPSNYVQRAGRAGRRLDSSAFIMTFCGLSSHDYTFFNNPLKMIYGRVDPPLFKIDNEKIIKRHITATCLGYYFRMHQDAFVNMKNFIEGNHTEKFIEFIDSCKNDDKLEIGTTIDNWILKSPELITKYGNYNWIDFIKNESKSALLNMEERVTDLIDIYRNEINYLNETKPINYGNKINYCEMMIAKINEKNSVIQYMSDYSVIPGYGFPVDNVVLRIFDPSTNMFDDKYNLERDLSIAISEYAPESEIIVDNKKYTSRYLYTPFEDSCQETYYYVVCPHCGRHNIAYVKDVNQLPKCKYCGESFVGNITEKDFVNFIKPSKGFVTDRQNKKDYKLKPARTYAGEVIYVGEGKDSINECSLNDIVKIFQYKDEELLVLNTSKFYYCPKCGYTKIDRLAQTSNISCKHKNYKGSDCSNETLHKTELGHMFKTDIVKITFERIGKMLDYECALSTLYALLEGISIRLNIERTDIDGILIKDEDNVPYSFVVYDNVSGGAGYVKQLMDKQILLDCLNEALTKVSQNCCSEDTSCYNCLRNYRNQKVHNHLKRGLAKETIEMMLRMVKDKEI